MVELIYADVLVHKFAVLVDVVPAARVLDVAVDVAARAAAGIAEIAVA